MYSLEKKRHWNFFKLNTCITYIQLFNSRKNLVLSYQKLGSVCYSSLYSFGGSCSSADEGDEGGDPSTKAAREKERRQANNVRER